MDVLREHAKGRTGTRRVMGEAVLSVIAAGVLILLAQLFVIQLFTIPSASMSPILLPGDSVLVNRLIYHLHPPRRADIIALRFPQANGRKFVKRVIGLPGDIVMERNGRFYVNGALLAQAQTAGSEDELAPGGGQLPRLVPAGRLYVLGDNPVSSLDSRFWGTVGEQDVAGKVFLICWSRGKHWWEARWDRVGRWLP